MLRLGTHRSRTRWASFGKLGKAYTEGAFETFGPFNHAGRKIEWRVEGVAPFRRFVASWYKLGVYGNGDCNDQTPTTFQIVVNEATSIIEVFIAQKECSPIYQNQESSSILGIQNWNRDKAVSVPGKNATLWTAQKEAYRFIPSGSTSRFVSSQLVDYTTGAILETATFAETTPGFMDITFPTQKCPTQNSEKYIVRTTYKGDCNSPTLIVVNDTITINKSVLPLSYSSEKSNCAVKSGTITANVLPGPGVAGPYRYELNPGAIVINSPNPTVTFQNLASGHYSLVVTGAGTCTGVVSDIEVLNTGTFDVPFVVNPPSCQGAQNASIVLSPPVGGGPYTFTINNSNTTSTITGLPASGPYQIEITASPTCKAFVTVDMIPPGAGVLTGQVTVAGTTCLGVNNGSIIATATSGSGPYQYSINNGQTWQPGNTFNNLAPGNYNVQIKEGPCISSPIPATIAAGSGLGVALSSNAASCAGAKDGNLVVTMNNGSAPYTITITGGVALTQTITTNTLVVGGLGIGDYFVSVQDASGCAPVVNPGTVTVAAKAGFTAYLSGLRNRMYHEKVHVVTVLPGFVNTKMTADLNLPAILTAQPAEVGNAVYKAVIKKKNTIYVKWFWRWIMLIITSVPETMFKKKKL
ncbi:MAG: hypothetical protein EOP49_23155 [Sphingobacteriales bacterium]|nr:MAG: hypothetical protein EOP49_23155 [Sphingobacteriales bacterium]